MEEFIGSCTICKKEIYCINGFLNGLIQPDGTLRCFSCDKDSFLKEEY